MRYILLIVQFLVAQRDGDELYNGLYNEHFCPQAYILVKVVKSFQIQLICYEFFSF